MSTLAASLSPLPTGTPAAPASQAPASSAAPSGFSMLFHDVLEIVNPLQHIPIVSTIYRALTGDQIEPAERIAGDALYGGVIGFASSVANVVFQQVTGKDFGDTVLAYFEGNGKSTAVASSKTSPSAPPSSGSAGTATSQGPTAVASAAPTVLPASRNVVQNVKPAYLIPRNPSFGIGATQATPLIYPSSIGAMQKTTPAPTPSTVPAPSASIVPPTASDLAPLIDKSGNALLASLNRDGVSSDMGLRAIYAYRKSLGMPASTGEMAAP